MKAKFLLVSGALFGLLLLAAAPITFLLYKLAGVLSGEESMFISGVVSAAILCPLVTKKVPEKPILICFISTFLLSSLLAAASLYLANIFETFLVPLAFYIICLVGVVSVLLTQEFEKGKAAL